MATRNPTYYEILGVKPGAKHTEVGIAFNRRMAAQRREDVAPDLQGVTKIREAYEVLSDLDRRAEYDAQLRAALIRPAFSKGQGLVAAGFLVLVGAGLYWHLRPQEAPAAPGKTYQEILNGAIPAVARLSTIDISGNAQPAGLAFAIDEGVLVTSCRSITPTTQLTVEFAKRVVPARVTMTDEALGLCKLEVANAGSWPLAVSDAPPRPGDRAYAAVLNTKGEVGLREVQVKNLKASDKGTVVLTNVAPDHAGTPLLDIHGRVVAVANLAPDGQAAYVPLPKSWGEPPPKPSKPEPYEREAQPAQEKDAASGSEPGSASEPASKVIDPAIADLQPKAKMPSYVSPEQQKRLQKAFRPPPNVPDDL